MASVIANEFTEADSDVYLCARRDWPAPLRRRLVMNLIARWLVGSVAKKAAPGSR
jgi:hypothetical protein